MLLKWIISRLDISGSNLNQFFSKVPSFYFSIPKRNSLIIFDDLNSKYIKSSIDYKQTYEIKFRNNRINLFALLYSLIFFYKSTIKIEYINFFLEKSKLKILVTTNYNRLIIYQIKHYYPEVKIVVIQNGSFGEEFLLKLKNSTYKNPICDYFFCFSSLEKKKIEKKIKAKFIVLGSLKNNFYKIDNNYKEKQLLFISQYRKALINKPEFRKFYETEKILLPIILNFCKKNKLKLAILPGEENSLSQFEHYKKILKSKNFFIYKMNLEKSYQRTDHSLFSITVDSSLGFEALSRSNKVGFFDFFSYNEKSFYSKQFFNKDGKFFLGFYNKHKINKILKYIYTVNNKDWKNQNFNKMNHIIYDKNNSKLNKVIKSIIK